MSLTLKFHQLLQAISLVGDEESTYNTCVTLGLLNGDVYVWHTSDPSSAYKLSNEIPPALFHEELHDVKPWIQLSFNFA